MGRRAAALLHFWIPPFQVTGQLLAWRSRLRGGVSGNLVVPAAFKAVERSYPRSLVGSIPIRSRHFRARIGGVIFELHTYGMGAPCRKDHAVFRSCDMIRHDAVIVYVAVFIN